MSQNGLDLYLKEGGSQFSKDQPFIQMEATFNQKFKMEKLAKTVSKQSKFEHFITIFISRFLTPFTPVSGMTSWRKLNFTH